jgi:hypothetical protein
MMSHLCNRCVREFLILARTWFAFGLPSKTGCDRRSSLRQRTRQTLDDGHGMVADLRRSSMGTCTEQERERESEGVQLRSQLGEGSE